MRSERSTYTAPRRWVWQLACTFAAAVLSAVAVSHAAERPNVLMIVVDDMNDWVGCLGGHPDVKTPNIDRLAASGSLFANAALLRPGLQPLACVDADRSATVKTGIHDNSVVWHEVLPNVVTIPQHFRASGYQVVGGGKVNHHMPGFNRGSDWDEYFDQVFSNPYQDQLSRGLDVSHFQWPAGFPRNGLDSVRALSKPPKNPREFDWGATDVADHEMGDGQMVEWAVRFLEQPRDRPSFWPPASTGLTYLFTHRASTSTCTRLTNLPCRRFGPMTWRISRRPAGRWLRIVVKISPWWC